MRTRSRIFFTILPVAVLAGFAWLVLPPSEPKYQGKTLTSWLARAAAFDFGTPSPPMESTIRNESKIAVRQIGTNAIPFLLSMASAHDSELKSNVLVLARRLLIFHRRYTPEAYRDMAIFGFYSLGPEGKNGAPSLIKMLESPYWEVRATAAECLGHLGSEANQAVPLLISQTTDSNRIVRWSAIMNLGRIHSHPEVVVPSLLKNLNTSNEVITTIYALGEFGADAKPAVSALLPYLNDQEEDVRSAATNALKQIDPETAAKAGIR